MTQDARPARQAATVVLVRDAAAGIGIEVLLLKRVDSKDHTSGAWVFPGGVVDEDDRSAEAICDLSDANASARLGLSQGGLAFYAAAIRECWEECGILLATSTGKLRTPIIHAADRGADLRDFCEARDVRLAASQLTYIAHWLTPRGRSKRFDTRFFIAAAPQNQTAVTDGHETLRHAWVSPVEALMGEFTAHLMTPTRTTLEALEPFRSVQEVMGWAASLLYIACVQPRLALGSSGLCSITAAHPAFDEIGKLDPEGRGDAWCHLQVGLRIQLGPYTARITDAAGQNRYHVRTDDQEWELVPSDTIRLVPQDRIIIAPRASPLPRQVRDCADWLAPEDGFLVRLS